MQGRLGQAVCAVSLQSSVGIFTLGLASPFALASAWTVTLTLCCSACHDAVGASALRSLYLLHLSGTLVMLRNRWATCCCLYQHQQDTAAHQLHLYELQLSSLSFRTGYQSCRWHGEVAHHMVQDITQAESKAERSLMHRFNIAKVSLLWPLFGLAHSGIHFITLFAFPVLVLQQGDSIWNSTDATHNDVCIDIVNCTKGL